MAADLHLCAGRHVELPRSPLACAHLGHRRCFRPLGRVTQDCHQLLWRFSLKPSMPPWRASVCTSVGTSVIHQQKDVDVFRSQTSLRSRRARRPQRSCWSWEPRCVIGFRVQFMAPCQQPHGPWDPVNPATSLHCHSAILKGFVHASNPARWQQCIMLTAPGQSCRIRTRSCCRWTCCRRRCARSAPRRPTRAWSPDSATWAGICCVGACTLSPKAGPDP